MHRPVQAVQAFSYEFARLPADELPKIQYVLTHQGASSHSVNVCLFHGQRVLVAFCTDKPFPICLSHLGQDPVLAGSPRRHPYAVSLKTIDRFEEARSLMRKTIPIARRHSRSDGNELEDSQCAQRVCGPAYPFGRTFRHARRMRARLRSRTRNGPRGEGSEPHIRPRRATTIKCEEREPRSAPAKRRRPPSARGRQAKYG